MELLVTYAVDGACSYHRALMPMRYCEEYLNRLGVNVTMSDAVPKGYDVYWFHGLPTPMALTMAAKNKHRGAKIVWSMDDDFLTIPDWNPAKPTEEGMSCWQMMLGLTDVMLTSTLELAETFKKRTHVPVLTAPNMVELSRFPIQSHKELNDGQKTREYNLEVTLPVRVVYSGGNTHREDVAVIDEAVCHLMERTTPRDVVVIFNGIMPPSKLLSRYLHRGLIHQPAVPFAQYQNIINQIKPDVYLAPLAQVPFNESKSNLRIIEGWALNACPVATDFGPYKCVASNQTGVLVSDVNDWTRLLVDITKDHGRRNRLALSGRRVVETMYDWSNADAREHWHVALDVMVNHLKGL